MLKAKAEKAVELCSSLVSRKGECSKLIFPNTSVLYYKLFCTGI